MIHVMFVMSDLGGGGAERSLLELLCNLDRSLIEPTLFLLQRTGVYLDRVPQDVRVCWGVEGRQRLRGNLGSVAHRVVVESAKADVVVGAMETTSSYFAWLGAVARRKPFVGWVRTDLDLHLQLLPKWHSFLSQMMYPRCNAVVVPSTGSRDSINRIIPIAGDKLKVINNPVNSEEVILLASQESPAWADAILSKPIILGVGRLDLAQKGFDLLIRAHALVRAQNSDHNLLILGEGPDRAALERLAQALGVKGSVFMPGFVRNPFPFFKAAVAFAAPSRIDGFGRVLLEAMILGTPVIASDASGPTEVLQNGKYGISVPMDNVAMLSTAMHSLLTSVTLREEYSRRSLARAHDLGGKGIAAQWNELLCNLTIHPALRAADAAHTPDFRRCPDSPR